MSLTKIIAALWLTFVCMGSTQDAHAQGNDPSPFAGLELSDGQRADIALSTENYRRLVREILSPLVASGAAPSPSQKARVSRIVADHNARIRALLTANQRIQFELNVARILEARRETERQRLESQTTGALGNGVEVRP